ncbi:MAG: hypothetical protein DRI44_01580, partial [Chlamydiae bacterium]
IHFFLSILFAISINAAVKNTRTSAIYDKIYLAVWAAESGDTLLVAKGVYTNDWIPMDHKSLNIKGNYEDDFSVQYQMNTVETIINAGQYYAAWASSCTSYLEYVHLNAGEHGLIAVSSVVTSRNCFIEFNTNSSYGAGILAYNSSKIILNNSHVWDNTVDDINGKGGGIYLSNNCELVMIIHTDLLRNEAGNGGGIYAKNAKVNMEVFTSIYGCNAINNGGGVYLENSTLEVNDGALVGVAHVAVTNTAENGDGGGIYALNSIVTFDNEAATLDNIAHNNGGSIYVSNSTLTVKNDSKIGATSIETGNGKAGNNGGGIYAINSTIIFTNNATLIRGQAENSGGGLYANKCNVYFYSSVVGDSNYAKNLGGGIYIYNGKAFFNNTIFKNNIANGSGGALRLYYRAYSEINDCIFEENSSGNDGGGLAMSGMSTAIVYRSDFYYNEANDDGGGIYLGNNSYLNIEKFKINNNLADKEVADFGYGGAICLFDSKADLIAGNFYSYILTNKAEKGGGVYVGNNSALTCIPSSGGMIITEHNTLKIVYNNATSDGGGMYVQGNSSVVTSGKVYFTNNGAENGGAAYACDNSSFKMFNIGCLNRPKISQNGSLVNGGGIMLSNSSEFVGQNCRITENIARNNGGGIYSHSSTAIVSSVYDASAYLSPQCELNNNIALKVGGAVYGVANSYFELNGAGLTNNIALVYAGAIESYSSKMNIYNTLIINNKAPICGSIASLKSSSVGLYFSTIANNGTNVFDTGSAFIAGSITLTNCIVYNNIENNFTGAGTKNIGYSDIEGGFTGAGNINANPEFNSDYSLIESSPCVDTGLDIGITYDCVGNIRPYGANVDMGAYEFVPEPGFYLLFIIFQLLFINYCKKKRFLI